MNRSQTRILPSRWDSLSGGQMPITQTRENLQRSAVSAKYRRHPTNVAGINYNEYIENTNGTLINKTTLSNSCVMPAGSDRIIKEEEVSTDSKN